MKDKHTEVGVIVGRFQVDTLTDGHINLINCVKQRHNKVIILLGVPKMVGTRRNPLDYDMRRLMIQDRFPDIITLPLPNCRYNEDWSASLDSLLTTVLSPMQKVTLYGSRDSFIPSYTGRHPCQELEDPVCIVNMSGTAVRKRIATTVLALQAFRAGVIHAAYQGYPRVIPTVDIAIIDFNKNKVLVGKKEGEDGYRFIGGFSDTRDSSFEYTAAREVLEETNVSIGTVYPVGSFNIPDWRTQDTGDVGANNGDVIRTTLYITPYTSGAPVPKDDIAELHWIDFSGTSARLCTEEHHDLFNHVFIQLPSGNSPYSFILEHIRNASKNTK